MTLQDTKQQKGKKIKKPLTGIQIVAEIFEVRTDHVSRVITDRSLCTESKVDEYKQELELINQLHEAHISKRRRQLKENK